MKEEIKEENLQEEVNKIVDGLIIMQIGKLEHDLNRMHTMLVATNIALLLVTICVLVIRIGG